MFVVRPIQSKELQRAVCEKLNAEYTENALAYFAADVDRETLEITDYIGVCQFIFGGVGTVTCIKAAKGREQDEAITVMLRTVMSFMHRCGIKTAELAPDGADEEIIKNSGFREQSGVYSIDLELFYASPCSYTQKEQK